MTAIHADWHLIRGLAIAININPFTHVINTLRALILQGNIITNIKNILFVILLLVLMCCISFTCALKRLKKETSQ